MPKFEKEEDGSVVVGFTEAEYQHHEAGARLIHDYKQRFTDWNPIPSNEIVGHLCEVAVREWLVQDRDRYCRHTALTNLVGPDLTVWQKGTRKDWEIDVKGRSGTTSLGYEPFDITKPPPQIYCWCSYTEPYLPSTTPPPAAPPVRGWGRPTKTFVYPSSRGFPFGACKVRVVAWSWGQGRVQSGRIIEAGATRPMEEMIEYLEPDPRVAHLLADEYVDP